MTFANRKNKFGIPYTRAIGILIDKGKTEQH